MASDRLDSYLRASHVRFFLDRPLLVVCPSSAKRSRELNLRGLRVPGADALPELRAVARIERTVSGSRGYSEELAGFLRGLVRGQEATSRTEPLRYPAGPVLPSDPDAGW